MATRAELTTVRQRVSSLLERSAPTPLGQLHPGAEAVEVSGTTVGDDGSVLTAPASGRPCVWYRSARTAYSLASTLANPLPESAFEPPTYVPSSLFGVRGSVSKSLIPHAHPPQIEESTALLRVECDGAAVGVDPTVALIDSATVSANLLERDEHGHIHALVQEWIIEPGQAIIVIGAVGPSSGSSTSVVPDGQGDLLVSTRTRSYLQTMVSAGVDQRRVIFAAVGAGLAVVILLVVLLLLIRS